MKTNSRITSILKASYLDTAVTGFDSFSLSNLVLPEYLECELPVNLRLGHLVEKIVSKLIESSSNFEVYKENLQVIDGKRTVGELDFIIQNKASKQYLHIELAYKFYLLDPSISAIEFENWIGPNRRDSLKEKLSKLKSKQFPLLKHKCIPSLIPDIEVASVVQQLCFLVSLFIPYEYKGSLDPVYRHAVKGYYMKLQTFCSLDQPENTYYIPQKIEWGMNPATNETWVRFEEVQKFLQLSMEQKQAPLVWQKSKDRYLSYFIVWW